MGINPYESPQAELPASPPPANSWDALVRVYYPAFRTAILLQLGLAVLTALVLDMGQTHRAFWVAFLCQWLMVAMIRFRRPLHPTEFDLALIRYGIIPIFLLIANGGPWLVRLAGREL